MDNVRSLEEVLSTVVRDKVSFLKIKKVLCYFLVKDIIYLCTISQLICSLRINSSRRTHIGHVSVIVLGSFLHHQLFHRASMGLCPLRVSSRFNGHKWVHNLVQVGLKMIKSLFNKYYQ